MAQIQKSAQGQKRDGSPEPPQSFFIFPFFSSLTFHHSNIVSSHVLGNQRGEKAIDSLKAERSRKALRRLRFSGLIVVTNH